MQNYDISFCNSVVYAFHRGFELRGVDRHKWAHTYKKTHVGHTTHHHKNTTTTTTSHMCEQGVLKPAWPWKRVLCFIFILLFCIS